MLTTDYYLAREYTKTLRLTIDEAFFTYLLIWTKISTPNVRF